MFKLQVGDVCKLNEVIPGLYKSYDWKTGLYRVKTIWAPFTHGRDRNDPRRQSYQFEKIRKDGTVIKSFANGYTCLAWDKFIDSGKVTKLGN